MGRQPHRPIEPLEARRFFSISLGAGQILNVHGNPSAANTITVGLGAGDQSVYATVSYTTRKGLQTQTISYPSTRKIRQVTINGGNLSDTITIDQTNGSFPIKTVILSHNGNDTITTGDEPDKIVLGSGADSVNSGNGNDSLYAGHGPDTLIGGSGTDIFHGGSGHDDIVTGNGTNYMLDPVGHDTLLGGTGHDWFIVKNIALDPDNNYDPSKDTLRKYVPPNTSNSDDGGFFSNLLDNFLNPYGL